MEKNAKRLVSVSIFILGFLIIGFFGYSKSKNLILGPRINIIEPKNGSAITEPLITISGTAENISRISLNGGKIFTDSDGNFKEKLLLLKGYNILTLEAEDRFGKKTKKTLELVYKSQIKENIASSSPPL